jgi:hypothetical protein
MSSTPRGRMETVLAWSTLAPTDTAVSSPVRTYASRKSALHTRSASAHSTRYTGPDGAGGPAGADAAGRQISICHRRPVSRSREDRPSAAHLTLQRETVHGAAQRGPLAARGRGGLVLRAMLLLGIGSGLRAPFVCIAYAVAKRQNMQHFAPSHRPGARIATCRPSSGPARSPDPPRPPCGLAVKVPRGHSGTMLQLLPRSGSG